MNRLDLPDLLAGIMSVRRMCLFDPFMVPTVINGVVYGANVETVPKPQLGLSVADFALGYTALGFRHAPIMVGDFGTAVGIEYSALPSRWADRAARLYRAFGPARFDELRSYVLTSGLTSLLADVEDAEEIVRFETPRRAIIVHALVLGLQHDGPGRLTLPEYARIAEPTATDAEITDAAHAALAWAADGLADPEPVVRLDAEHGSKQEAYL